MESINSYPEEPQPDLPGEQYDRRSKLEAFENTKTGVKGLVDSGITKLPRIHLYTNTSTSNYPSSECAIPVIDLQEIRSPEPQKRKKVLNEIKSACEEWGVFQVVNHGVPVRVLNEMLVGVKRFHEQDDELKKPYYSRDESKKFKYYSCITLLSSPVAEWKDSFSCTMAPAEIDPLDLPEICRDILLEYTNEMKKLGISLLELMSQMLGLKPEHLKEMGCAEGINVQGHYYPACPAPEMAIGTFSHSDTGFFTILLQDNTGGLQILHDNYWVNVHPLPDSLLINLGDFFQLITNDRFKSAVHRVVAQRVGPRISMACFFRTHFEETEQCRLYGPIKELQLEENPAIYKEISMTEYLTRFYGRGRDGSSSLSHFKL